MRLGDFSLHLSLLQAVLCDSSSTSRRKLSPEAQSAALGKDVLGHGTLAHVHLRLRPLQGPAIHPELQLHGCSPEVSVTLFDTRNSTDSTTSNQSICSDG